MKRLHTVLLAVVLSLVMAVPCTFAADDLAAKLSEVLSKAPAEKFWQVTADDVMGMIKAKKTDFVVVDARPNPNEFKQGHIPGAVQIPVQDLLKPDNLKKLPKGKKIILVCVTGQTQNLGLIALRALGYNAYGMKFGMISWQKGYQGGQQVQEAIKGAEAKNYPLDK
ncbi:MAG: rhodanese-like domain-containing protein [Nitrospiraceae bacterium]|nr:rhodanese-like domain-containing protein [Nitrospiraceae bacterium]